MPPQQAQEDGLQDIFSIGRVAGDLVRCAEHQAVMGPERSGEFARNCVVRPLSQCDLQGNPPVRGFTTLKTGDRSDYYSELSPQTFTIRFEAASPPRIYSRCLLATGCSFRVATIRPECACAQLLHLARQSQAELSRTISGGPSWCTQAQACCEDIQHCFTAPFHEKRYELVAAGKNPQPSRVSGRAWLRDRNRLDDSGGILRDSEPSIFCG